jgi:hypothetical protein
MTSHLLTLCFVLTAYGADLAPPLGISSDSAHEAPTNVSAYPTTQSAAKSVADLTGSASLPYKPRDYPQGDSTPHPLLATTSPRPPPLFTDPINAQRNPNLCTDPADLARNICSAEVEPTVEPVLTSNALVYPGSHACHGTATSDIKNFMKRLLMDDGPKADAKPRKWWILIPEQPRIWIIANKKDAPANIRGCGPKLFYTRTCTTPTTPVYHSNIPPLPPHPLALLQVAVYTNASAFTSMVAVDTPAAYSAQLVTACAAPSVNTTLSPTFQMGAYTNEIDFRLVRYIR